MKKILLTISSLVVTFSSAQVWNISGNSGTNPSTDFLGTIDAQPLIFKTNNSEKARITPNGNVGIGTSNPQARLDVNGEVYSTLSSDEGGNISFFNPLKSGSNANRWSIYNMTGGYGNGLQFWSYSQSTGNYGSRMTLSDNGNVGIGTASPQAKLDVNGDIHLQGLGKIYGWNDPVNYYIGKYPVTGSSGLDIHWYGGIKFGTAGGDAMQILSNGNVGVGNINPQAKLDVNGDVRIANIPASTSSTDQTLVVDAQGFVKKGSVVTGNVTLSEKQKVNARATGYAIIAAKNPGVNFSVFVIPWDGVNTLEYNANNQINPSWHPQVVIKGNYFNQAFDGSDFTDYSSFVTSQSDFDLYKSTGTQWWIVCSTLPSFSKSITSNENTGNVAITNKLEAKEIKVTLTPTADFVFEKEYGLPKLEEVEKFVKENKHLPEIASAKEMEKEGVNVGEFQIKLLQKIEELTLYSIDLNKKNKEQEALIKIQADILKSLNERLEKIEKAKQK